MAEYEISISGVHYAANGDSVAGQKDTEEMHMRTRELLSRIDRVRPIVTLSPAPENHVHERALQARALGKRIGRVALECVDLVWDLLRASGMPMLLAKVKEVAFGATRCNDSQKQTIELLVHWLRDDYEQSHCEEIESLAADTQVRLANAIEKAANKPATQHIYGDKNEFQGGAQLLKMGLPEEFTIDDVMRCFGLAQNNSARARVFRLQKDGLVEKVDEFVDNGTTKAKYKKTGAVMI